MKRGFARPTPEKPPVIKPENIVLPTPLSIPPPEGKPWWLIVVGVVVVGLLGGMVAMVFASGSHVFGGIGSIFPLFMMVGIMMMMFRGMGGGQQQMSRPKLDAMRAQFMLMLDMLRETAQESADSMDANYRWFHPAPNTLAAAVGSPRMWERKPDGKDLNFGVVRVGVGMTRPEVTWGEPQNMPTDIELEPVTGKALQEFGRYQSVVYNLPKMVSLLVEPWYALVGEREQVLGLMRAIICQLAFSHGPDHVQMIVVSSDLDQWDWVKWLPHFGDSRRHDAAGNARMVYTSVREFAAEQAELFAGRGSFTPRHASSSAQTPTPHTVIIADVDDPQWEYVISAEGVDGVTFFDLTGSSMWTDIPERKLQFDKTGVIEALPRDRDTWMVIDDKAWFFALTDQVSIAEAEEFAQKLAQWRLAEAYEEIGQRVAHIGARDILSYYGIDDPGNIDFDSLWASRTDTMGRSRLRAPFGNRSDNGELLFLDMKSLDEGGDGPHGVMSGTTGSGKSTLVRTVIESLMLSHPPEELQFVLADLKGGSAVKPFAGVPHVSRIITDLEEDQALMERFLDALWGEIARRKAICDSAGVDDAKEYNSVRARMRARGQDMAPLPMLVVVIDEFYEWFRIMPTAVDVLDSIGRQGRAYWIHLMMASQTIESRAEKLMENMGYRLVLKARTAGAAQAAGVPNAVNLPAQAGLGYFRKSLEDIIRFQAEFLWRDYFQPGVSIDGEEAPALVHSIDYIRPQLFTNSFTPLEVSVGGPDIEPVVAQPNGEVLESDDIEGGEDEDEEGVRTPKVGTVIIDQLRKIKFEPYRLWQPPLTQPVAIDDLVNRFLGRPWHKEYGSACNLVFPIGIIDRPYKHDQPPWTVDTSGPGANVLILGAGGSGKTTALQTLICSAALTHTPQQVQFYCLAYSSTALTTVSRIPHVGEVAGPTDPYGVRRTVAELLALVRERKRSFLECGIASMEMFRRRKFGGEAGPVPDDGFGDVYLVIDNYRALAEENEVLIEQVNVIINQGPSFGVHVVVTADRESELRPPVRSGFGSRIELRLAAVEDAKLVRSRFAKDVPVKPGRGMVAVNYVRLDSDPQAGLHTLVARPALGSTPDNVFECDSVVAAVSRLTSAQAPPVRRLPARFGVEQVRELASRDTRQGVGAGGIAWAISELDLAPVYLNFAENSHLMVTGRRECGRTTTLATIMSEIGRLYAPGASSAPPPAPGRPSAQVWLVDPRRQLLTALGSDYVERFAYNLDGVVAMMGELAAALAGREPPPGLSAEELLSRSWWSGPEIFLIVDDIQQLPPGFDSPLHKAVPFVNRAADVGLHVIVTRTFGGWSSAGSDPMLRALHQANAPLLVMDADPDEGFIRGKMKGGPLPRGRGLLMAEDTGVFVQVAATEVRR
ncbi:ESX conserved component EccC5 (corresponds to EccCa and EccCb de M. tuberculosis H37Rv, which is split by a H37Rv specific stop codon) [Mycobacterium canettii CIPT 140060008]|uniref:Type VII secretion system ESX-5 FtsK/SpoIIIE family ATPase EccC5 n=2 Tax=Mycobacterium canetti TaxID=78331 RepID=A0ABV1MGL0_9MYCO|nr:type VII secretion system ESX-5 FtsK/SpoIIIE family ATPase EccC5 [Mycobacterium canetti]MBA2786433.1 type VII secretion system ESX-5 FtsK/SpoIIIE family ATPase EccC5 [Mycobacterium canetti]WRO41836.1 ESX5 conserved type VII secretion system protein EccC5 [Mycobacterium canetti]CCK51724.1 ESX conserved component EccC5 (corresponds to EccCa and EccCb de M. tuberculosis H37Rv, which is split by a H37Rv specific stop codon) [Mycobacterium canettii CIPT 140060008]